MAAIREFFSFLDNGLDTRKLLLTTFMAVLTGVFIWFAGRVTGTRRRGVEREEAGRVLLPVLSALTVFCSRSSLALAIAGAVAAAALVLRYKTAKETEGEQILFLLWGTAAGICIGERQYLAAAVMCATVFVILLVFHLVRDDSVVFLVIRGAAERELEAEGIVFRVFDRKAVMKSKQKDREGFTLVFAISEKQLKKAAQERNDITEMVGQINGITSVLLTREIAENEK